MSDPAPLPVAAAERTWLTKRPYKNKRQKKVWRACARFAGCSSR
jgi:hypothetical protein